MTALRGDLEDHGGSIAFNTPDRTPGAGEGRLEGRLRRRAAMGSVSMPWSMRPGSGRNTSAARPKAIRQMRVPRLVLAKGNYFGFAGRPVFSRLIYPVPAPGGLGVHVTLDLAGRMRFGPDVEWIERENYDVDPGRAAAFYQRIRDYWPDLPEGSLLPDYAGHTAEAHRARRAGGRFS